MNDPKATAASGDFPEGGALLVGGSGGIGRAIARRLVSAGVSVSLTYRANEARATALAEELNASGGRVRAVPLDLRRTASIRSAVDDAVAAWSRLHTLVYAAGPDLDQEYYSQIDADDFRRVVETDVHGFFDLTQAALPVLKSGGGGAIVAVTSAGLARYPARDALSVAPKAAVEAIVKAIAVEEGKYGVRANTVAPGVIDAGVFHRLEGRAFPASVLDTMRRNTALRRFGTAEEVADTVVFLASARAGYITGQRLAVDGGFST